MSDSLRFGLFFCCVTVTDRTKKHVNDFLKMIAAHRCSRYSIYISRIYLLHNFNRGIRTTMMAFIHNYHAVGIDPFIELSPAVHRTNHCNINDSCQRIFISGQYSDCTVTMFFPTGFCFIYRWFLLNQQKFI